MITDMLDEKIVSIYANEEYFCIQGINKKVTFKTANLCGDFSFFQYSDMETQRQLHEFFANYQGKIIYYDVPMFANTVFHLFVKTMSNHKGKKLGIETMFRNFEDIKVIFFLLENNCKKRSFEEKYLSQDRATDQGLNNKDIAEKNAKKILSFYIENYKTIEKYKLDKLYEQFLKPATLDLVMMRLEGINVNYNRLQEHIECNERVVRDCMANLEKSTQLKSFREKNGGFNINNKLDVNNFIFKHLGVDAVIYGENGMPIASIEAYEIAMKVEMEKYGRSHDSSKFMIMSKIILILEAQALLNATKNLNNHIIEGKLIGNYDFLSCASGRTYTRKANTQGLPKKLLQSHIFQAPEGYIKMSADFAGFEDRIETMLSQDSNRIAILQGDKDSHEEMAKIYFNDISKDGREKAKRIATVKSYGGSYKAIQKSCHLNFDEAMRINEIYNQNRTQTIDFRNGMINLAKKRKYLVGAFGIPIRCIEINDKNIEHKVMSLTVYNALIQSYSLLTNFAVMRINRKLKQLERERDIIIYNIKHDEILFYVKDDEETKRLATEITQAAMQFKPSNIKNSSVNLKININF